MGRSCFFNSRDVDFDGRCYFRCAVCVIAGAFFGLAVAVIGTIAAVCAAGILESLFVKIYW